MSPTDWILDRQKYGIYTFSFEELKDAFPALQPKTISNEMVLLARKGLIVSPYKGFYSLVLPHYQLRGIVPPVFYIDQLMKYLKRSYYISLLSAAEMHGAAHQRPQRLQIFSTKPNISMSESKNEYLKIHYRPNISRDLIWSKNSEVDTILYSSPELTAADLVQYNHLCGGLSNVATVLAELAEVLDFNRKFDKLYEMVSKATLQRLGFILDEILEERELADTLYINLKAHDKDIRRILLAPKGDEERSVLNRRWKVIVNQEIEIDEI